MSELSIGIVGLPNVGKSTLFNALTKKGAAASNYPFCTIDPNKGVVEVSDDRLDLLAKLSNSAKMIPAHCVFFDIAGLVEGASKGEGLGNKFLANIRETNVILHVVRCFEDPDVVHVRGKIDPIADIEIIELELALADLQMCQNSLVKLEKQAKGNRELLPTVALLKRCATHLDEGKSMRELDLSSDEKEILKIYPFLTLKDVIYATNVDEGSLPSMENEYVQKVREHAKKTGSEVISICSKFEEELGTLNDEEAKEFLESVGLKESGLKRLVSLCFKKLGLITYFTTGPQETRAWTIRQGTNAKSAAGEIHSDIEKGFIRAEVISVPVLKELGSRAAVKEAGKMRSEGRDYIVDDGDVLLFFHN
ncbi:MAG: redox-regulated ATPase YchF [Candidatus Algichlamydia australiensis]|nr:redox-regulated ATPase YchF [Chlamydiales bacterium]